MEQTDYRWILKEEWSNRSRYNPAYSLRAYARDLGLTPSALSQVLNGKQGISSLKAKKICEALDFSENQEEFFCTLVEARDARAKKKRAQAQERLEELLAKQNQLTVLEDAQFKLISDWYHFAIMELMKTSNFQSSPRWIAKRLGLTPVQVETAIERLKTLKLIEEVKGELKLVCRDPETTDGISSGAVRKYTEDLLKKAIDALHLQSVEERDFSTLTFSMSSKKLPLIQKEIRSFKKRLHALAKQIQEEGDDDLTEVYTLSTQCFRMTTKNSKETVK